MPHVKRVNAMAHTVNGQLAGLLLITSSHEWKHAIARTLIWLQMYERDTVARRVEELRHRYHVHPGFHPERFARLGLDYNTMRERYAVWKNIQQVLQNPRFK